MKRSFFALILVFAMILTSSAVVAKGNDKDNHRGRFSDISDTWAKDSIEKRVREDIFGDKSGKFYPNKQITRIEFVILLHDAMDININYFAANDISKTYKDMKNTDKGASQLIDLVTTGIIDRKGTFGPNEKLTREELIHYVINALNYATGGNYPLIKMLPPEFKDGDKIDAAYKYDIVVAQLLGFIKSGSGNMFYPKHNATRAEAIAFIDRMLSYVEKLNPVKADVSTEMNAVVSNGELKMVLTLKNNSKKDVVIEHPSAQKYDFIVYSTTGENLYQYSANKRFMFALTETVIKAGESVSFTDTLDKAAYAAISSKASYVKGFVTGTSESFDINEDGYKAVIGNKKSMTVSAQAKVVNGALEMSLTLTNNSRTDITINHTSSQTYDFSIIDAKGETLYTWSADRSFMQMLSETVIRAGKSVTYKETLDKAKYDLIKASASYVVAYIIGTSEDFEISADGYKVLLNEKAKVDITTTTLHQNGTLNVSVTLTNNSSREVTVGHGAGQLFNYGIYDANGKVLYTWTDGKAFIMMYAYTTIKPGESVSFSDTLDKAVYSEIKDKMSYVKGFVNGSTEDFAIDANGYKAVIKAETGVAVSVEARIVNAELKMVMEVKNTTSKDVVINHSSGQRFDFKIFDATGTILYTWSADKMFSMGMTTTTIPAGKSVSFSDTLDKDTFKRLVGNMSYLKGYITGTSSSFTVDSNGYVGE